MRRRKRTDPYTALLAGAVFLTGVGLMGAGAATAQTINGGKPVTPQEIRPPADLLVDCAKAPKGAVTKLPADLARWATIYCTRYGAIFNSNDKYFGVFPDSGLRASFDAAALDNKAPEAGKESYFKAIKYTPLNDAEMAKLIEVDPIAAKIIGGKKTYQLVLTTSGDNNLSFIVIDPTADPFWVFPLMEKGLGSPAFFVISIATLNQARQ